MGSAIEIRQMMAEGKLPIAQFEIEASLKTAHGEERRELLFLLIELLKFEQKNIPVPRLLEAATIAFHEDRNFFHDHLPNLLHENRLVRLLNFKLLLIQDFESRGQLAELLKAISEYQIHCVENRIPFLEPRILELSQKYFEEEFSLSLQRISLSLMLRNSESASKEVEKLLLSLHESKARNSTQKISALFDILSSFELQGIEILYRNYCQLRLKGITEARDFKTLLECVIGFDDFRMLVLVLDLGASSLPDSAATSFVELLKSLPDYDFLYLEKHFPQLKKLFIPQLDLSDEESKCQAPLLSEKDLELESFSDESERSSGNLTPPMEEEETNLLQQLKHGDFTFTALCELTVSFLQSDYLRAARSASLRSGELATTDDEKMRALYLQITVLMKLSDYRAALDSALRAMDLVKSEDDLLSLMYVQAECQEKLNSKEEAKKILRRILEIDGEYRLARERLEKLNEA